MYRSPFPIARHHLATGFVLILLSQSFTMQTSGDTASWARTVVEVPIALNITGVHNAFRVTDKIFSGSQPEGEAAFAELAKLGVKTILSVDGSMPEIETARKYGLRYVHLPYGYDGVPTNRVVELTKLATSADGPFFVHCHHGFHRGPAAVAIMCEASEGWTPTRAEAWLHQAGTAADYPGLYRAAREFTLPTATELAAVKSFPEFTKASSLVEAMVAIDEHFTWLKASQRAGWKAPPDHADIAPQQEATILWEQLRELGRSAETLQRSDDYRAKLTDAELAADALRTALKGLPNTNSVEAAFKQLNQSCSACHRKYRNQ